MEESVIRQQWAPQGPDPRASDPPRQRDHRKQPEYPALTEFRALQEHPEQPEHQALTEYPEQPECQALQGQEREQTGS